MKLIDILVEELPKNGGWLRDVKTMTQDRGGDIWGYDCVSPCLEGGFWSSKSGEDLVSTSKIEVRNLAVDWNTAIITREQYEAALAAKNEGWIEWGGGECPVPEGALVDVRYRNSEKFPDTFGTIALEVGGYGATGRHWNHDGYPNDIIAYRLHQPQEAVQVKADDEADLNECIGQDAAPVWNGEGLPPVGCVCERSWAGDEWQSCKILFASGQIVVVKLKESGREDAYNIGDVTFRPILPTRSEAERKRDEAVAQLNNFVAMGKFALDEDLACAVYDAIAAGKIPGVKLDD